MCNALVSSLYVYFQSTSLTMAAAVESLNLIRHCSQCCGPADGWYKVGRTLPGKLEDMHLGKPSLDNRYTAISADVIRVTISSVV